MRRTAAIIALTLVYSVAYSVSMIATWLGRLGLRRRKVHRRIIVNGTFHNPNWFRAHITPLVESGYGEVILVCDEPIDELPNLVYRCPPLWAMRVFSRAGAKAIWTLMTGIQRPADIYVGYHIFPSAITALLCARLLGARAIYQVTSGPLELEGGGWNAENLVLTSLGGPSPWVERLAMKVTCQFDLVVVRGSTAEAFIRSHGFKGKIEIVTGSVRTKTAVATERDVDIIFVGRLTEYKRPDRLLDVVDRVRESLPEVRVLIVGDGPDRAALEARVTADNAERNVTFLGQRSDVLAQLARSRTFVLTSRWEGVSIAMLEAMAMGAVPVVNRVGDLADFAINGETGYVVEEDQVGLQAGYLVELLKNPGQLGAMSAAARRLVEARCDSDVLARRWHQIFLTMSEPG
ncbi:MAG: glycosyltransferase family 4 protein [Pseudomonadota bacterium]